MGSNGIPRAFPDLSSPLQPCLDNRGLNDNGSPPVSEENRCASMTSLRQRDGWGGFENRTWLMNPRTVAT